MQKPLLCTALLSLCLLIIPAAAWGLPLGLEVLPNPDPKGTVGDLMMRNKGLMADMAFTANGAPGTGIGYGRLVSTLSNSIQDQGARLLGIEIFSNDSAWQGVRRGSGRIWDETKPDTPNMPIPEPATILLLGIGMIGLAVISRRRIFR